MASHGIPGPERPGAEGAVSGDNQNEEGDDGVSRD